jgi:hypothetical protein
VCCNWWFCYDWPKWSKFCLSHYLKFDYFNPSIIRSKFSGPCNSNNRGWTILTLKTYMHTIKIRYMNKSELRNKQACAGIPYGNINYVTHYQLTNCSILALNSSTQFCLLSFVIKLTQKLILLYSLQLTYHLTISTTVHLYQLSGHLMYREVWTSSHHGSPLTINNHLYWSDLRDVEKGIFMFSK